MLPPEYLEGLPEPILELYALVEDDILRDMARRIAAFDYYIPAADWQNLKLKEAGRMQKDILKVLAKYTGRSEEELRKLMEKATSDGLRSDISVYEAHGETVPPISDSKRLVDTLNAGYAATRGTMRNITRTTANTATQQFERALDKAWLQVRSGGFSYDTAVRSAVKDLAGRGVEAIRYPTGHVDTLETAVRRAVVTGINQTTCRLQEELAAEMGMDLVEVSAHAGARPSHAVWQGKIFSLSGNSTKYPKFAEATGYGTGPGLGGWNCRHSFSPYYEGSPRAYPPELLEKYEAKDIEYDGQKMTEYEASQKQRYMERNIRKWKREYTALEAAGQDTGPAAAKLRAWREKESDFLAQTGLKKQSVRSQVAGFGRGQAGRATQKAKKELEKYTAFHYNKDGTIVVTDDWKGRKKPSIPREYKPFAVIETQINYKNGTVQIDRTLYSSTGVMETQIHSGPHNRPDKHTFGTKGEHGHTYRWAEDGTIIDRAPRELTDKERKEHADIIGGETDG